MSRPKKRNPTEFAVRRIMELAHIVSAESASPSASTERLLALAIERVLVRGSDRPIERAVDQLDARHDHEAADLVEFWADEAASSQLVAFELEGNPVSGLATAFVVPLLLVGPTANSLPLNIPMMDAVTRMTESFRRHRLVGPQPALTLLPALYRLEDLPTSWAERRQWLNSLTQAGIGHGPVSLPTPSAEADNRFASTDSYTIHLRFLLAVLIVRHGDHEPGPLLGADWSELANSADLARRVDAWQNDVASTLQTTLRNFSAVVAAPNLWTNGIGHGIRMFNQASLNATAETFFSGTGIAPSQVLAVITWHETPDEQGWVIRLDASAPDSLIWSCVDDPRDELRAIMDILRDLNISRMTIDEGQDL